MSPKKDPSAAPVRSKYAYLFSSVAELFFVTNGVRPDTNFDSIRLSTDEMYKDGQIDDYIMSNLAYAFEQYPTMHPSNVYKAYAKDAQAEKERHQKLAQLLDVIIADICELIADKIKERNDYESESFLKSLLLK